MWGRHSSGRSGLPPSEPPAAAGNPPGERSPLCSLNKKQNKARLRFKYQRVVNFFKPTNINLQGKTFCDFHMELIMEANLSLGRNLLSPNMSFIIII